MIKCPFLFRLLLWAWLGRVEFSTGGSSNIDSGKVSGILETKYQVKDLGMTLTEKWTNDNNLSTDEDVVDKLDLTQIYLSNQTMAFESSMWSPCPRWG